METDEFGTVLFFFSRKACKRERVQIRARPGSCGFQEIRLNSTVAEPAGFNSRK